MTSNSQRERAFELHCGSNARFLLDVPTLQWSPSDGDRDEFFMRQALAEAALATEEGEVPIGAVLVFQDRIIARDHNRRERNADPTAHAEILVLQQASVFFPSWRIEDSELFVTLEPCVMCAGALVQARVDRVVFGARDPKGGAAVSLFELLNDPRLNWRCDVCEGVLHDECAGILRDFFQARRGGQRDST
jgi:tRNA(adenine34) deaminase